MLDGKLEGAELIYGPAKKGSVPNTQTEEFFQDQKKQCKFLA